MHTKNENKRLTQKIASLEEELNTMRNRLQNLQSVILSNISHDIRTPMNAIVGFANLLANDKMDSKEKEDCIDHINSNSSELLEIIDNMIDASQLQSGDIKLYEKECYINDIMDDIYETYKESKSIKQKNLNLVVSKGEDDSFFMVTDFNRLTQIIHNLIGNATKFTNKGCIEFGYYKINRNKVRFYVKDSGIGLGSFENEDLFKPFRACPNHNNGGYLKGAGLGLSISKSLVELMGGEMWPESEQGKGTCFYFTVPVKRNTFFKTKLELINKISKRNIASLF
ncbi:MAG: sensor histidine kinase [bacterium]